MRKVLCGFVVLLSLGSTGVMAQQSSSQELDGETKMACSAILCLSSATRPAECARPISHYFSIVRRRFWDTLQARIDFLNMCPVQGAGMSSLKSAIVRGAGNCDAAGLNVGLYVGDSDGNAGRVLDSMPQYCSTYFGHEYTRIDPPRYVGTPERGGYWVEGKDYDAAMRAYTARWAEIDANRERSGGDYN
jgi:hypothetical protein